MWRGEIKKERSGVAIYVLPSKQPGNRAVVGATLRMLVRRSGLACVEEYTE
jgi:hypothetical protein